MSRLPRFARDRIALTRYRLRAAAYGFRLRRHHPARLGAQLAALLGVIGTAATLGAAAGVDFLTHRAFESGLGLAAAPVAVLGLFWLVVRYVGRPAVIMASAAASDESARILREDMYRGMQNAAAYGVLRKIYEDELCAANSVLKASAAESPLFEFVGVHDEADPRGYAAIALPAPPGCTVESLLGAVDLRESDGLTRYTHLASPRQALMRRWRQLDSSTHAVDLESGDNYRVLRLSVGQDDTTGPRLTIDVGIATYGQTARTCEALVNEFALFARLADNRILPDMQPETMLRCLPWRHATHKRAKAPGALFLEPVDRAACLGVAVVTLLDEGRHLRATLGTRSNHVGTYPRVLHVIPAGMTNTHQVRHWPRRAEQGDAPTWYLRTVMRSEFLEEWFDDDVLEESRIPDWRRLVDDKWAAIAGPHIELTGIAIDLLNLRPEACAMATVTALGDRLCWEYMDSVDAARIPLDEVGDIDRTEIVQGGAAALMLARRRIDSRSFASRDD